MRIPFYKYQGLGNDFIFFLAEDVHSLNYSQLAKSVCDRYYGIGADGMAVFSVDAGQKPRMHFFNADGSRAPMCGNGARSAGLFLQTHQDFSEAEKIVLISDGGEIEIEKKGDGFAVTLGYPQFEVELSDGRREIIREAVKIGEDWVEVTALVMTTDHAVVFTPEYPEMWMKKYGKALAEHPLFPRGTNVNFVEILDSRNIYQVTYERGVGLTLACGTGASASVAAAYRLHLTDRQVKVKMPGGELEITVLEDGQIVMYGPAKEIASGEYIYSEEQ